MPSLLLFHSISHPVPPPPPPPPPHVPSPLLQIPIQAYPYQQYSKNADIRAFFDAYNACTQTFLDWFNETPLGVWTSPNISGALLDWIGQGLYGIRRPVFSTLETTYLSSATGLLPTGVIATSGSTSSESGTAVFATDDYYKRTLTWFLYIGDGRHFNVTVFRKKVARWLYGVNGTDITLAQAQTVNIAAGVIDPPARPTLSQVPGSSLTATTYAAASTYVTPLGETTAGAGAILAVALDYLLSVASPPPENGAIGWNAYASTPTNALALGATGFRFTGAYATSGNPIATDRFLLTKQNTDPIAIGTAWLEPSAGLVAGPALPNENASNEDVNLIITIPASVSATFFQEAFQSGLLSYPFQMTASVVIA
jgi:hypothetical protein